MKNSNKNKFGDIIVDDSGYRYDGAYFIGKNGEHIVNPDNSKSAHLSIPYDITQYLLDATNKYKYIPYLDIQLRCNDKLIVEKLIINYLILYIKQNIINSG